MAKNNINSKSGFTIIEVVLVLAIAGLIFLMVFIAFPGLQRSQRDTQRRNDLANLATRIIDYQTNNRNQVPTGDDGWANFQSHYFMRSEYKDPDGNDYKIVPKGSLAASGDSSSSETFTSGKTWENTLVTDSNSESGKSHEIYVWSNAHCEGEKAVHDDSPRKVAFVYILESGNVYCGNN